MVTHQTMAHYKTSLFINCFGRFKKLNDSIHFQLFVKYQANKISTITLTVFNTQFTIHYQ